MLNFDKNNDAPNGQKQKKNIPMNSMLRQNQKKQRNLYKYITAQLFFSTNERKQLLSSTMKKKIIVPSPLLRSKRQNWNQINSESGKEIDRMNSWKSSEQQQTEQKLTGSASPSLKKNRLAESENVDPRRREKMRSPIDSIAIKTPLRGNVSAKHSSNHQTARTILSELCFNETYNAHVISGDRGVGKTHVAYISAQLPSAKSTYSEGIIWVGLGYKKSIQYHDLVEIYEQIFAQVSPRKQKLNFDNILYIPSASTIKSEEEKQEEKRAMFQAREIMSKTISEKRCLICLDGLFDTGDIRYFQFYQREKPVTKCRVLATAISAPFELIENVKSWPLSSMNAVAAQDFFITQLSPISINHPDFDAIFRDSHRYCGGNPSALRALSRLIDDKIKSENFEFLNKFVKKFESAPVDPKMQIFIILEASFSHSSLGDSFTKLAWRCFAAFCVVFTRENSRPCVPLSPVKALFQAVIERIGKTSSEPDVMAQNVDKIIDFMVDMGFLHRIDGFDSFMAPRQYYQVSSDVYQEFGEQLSANKDTIQKLNELLITEYTSMFEGINVAFGSNEIDYYMLKFLPSHSMRANELEDVSLTLQDARFVEERLKYMGICGGCKKHIEDTEAMSEMVRVTNKKMALLILATSYQTCTRVLLAAMSGKQNIQPKEEQEALDALWMLAFSCYKHFLVTDGCKILQKAIECDKSDDKKVIKLNPKLIHGLSKTPTDNKNQCSRAIILIGSAMAQAKMKRRDAIYLIHRGLKSLEESLGAANIETARAHVYVGEIFYQEFKMYRHALQYFREALPTFMRELGEESEELYDAIILIGKSCIHTGDVDTALDILRNIAPKLTGSIAIDVYIKVGYIYMIKGNHQRAVSILKKVKSKTTDESIIKQVDALIEKSVHESGRYTI